jgi:4-hydroxy-2-oxoheptanedioate aldolase
MAQLRPNRAKEKLARGEIVTCLAGVDTPQLVDFVGQIGVDAVWLEAEHGPVSFEDIGNLSRAADLWGMASVVRVGSPDYNTIYRTLDMGSMGVVVPHVDTVEEALAVVDGAKYAPIGRR